MTERDTQEKLGSGASNWLPWKKSVATYSVGLLIALYGVFVAEKYWNWLAVQVFHCRPITYLETLCAMILIGIFTRSGFPFRFAKGDLGYLKSIEFALTLCIPTEKLEEWKDYSNDQANLFFEAFSAITGALGNNTLLLGLGFLLHLAVTA